MISELTHNILQANEWGNKAARLSEASRLGLTVAPGLCIQYSAAFGSPVNEALSAWLDVTKPRRLVVRMSSVLEDRQDRANAGRTKSILNCPPDADALLQILRHDLLPHAEPWSDIDSGLSFIFQEQAQPQLGGVAFSSYSRLVAECYRNSTDAITSGHEPELRIKIVGKEASAEGKLAVQPIFLLAETLHTSCNRLREHFGYDVDVEWAWSAGVLLILQVRPITVESWESL